MEDNDYLYQKRLNISSDIVFELENPACNKINLPCIQQPLQLRGQKVIIERQIFLNKKRLFEMKNLCTISPISDYTCREPYSTINDKIRGNYELPYQS